MTFHLEHVKIFKSRHPISKGLRRKSCFIVLFLVISWVMLTGQRCHDENDNGDANVNKTVNQQKIQYNVTCLGDKVQKGHKNLVTLTTYKNPEKNELKFNDLCFTDGVSSFPASTQNNSTWSGKIAKHQTVNLKNISYVAFGARYKDMSASIYFTTTLSGGKISGTVSFENEY